MEKRNKLSFTSVSTYQECPKKYYLHYKENLRPAREKSALYFGKCLDQSFNKLLEKGTLKEALNLFYDNWGKAPDNLQYSKSDLDEDLLNFKGYSIRDPDARNWQSLLLKGEMIIIAFYEKALPKIKEVIAVQKPISIKNPEGDEVSGILDLIVKWEDGKTYLMDNKSSSMPYTLTSAKESNQLVLYYYVENDNLKLDGVGFIVFSKKINKNKVKTCSKCGKVGKGREKTCADVVGKTRCNGEFNISYNPEAEVQFILNTVDEKDEDRCIEMFDKANNGITNNNFEPNYKSCIGKYGKCTFYDYCKSGTMEGLVKKERKEEK